MRFTMSGGLLRALRLVMSDGRMLGARGSIGQQHWRQGGWLIASRSPAPPTAVPIHFAQISHLFRADRASSSAGLAAARSRSASSFTAAISAAFADTSFTMTATCGGAAVGAKKGLGKGVAGAGASGDN